MKKRIVFDADNTMGAGADTDDGLALMYLLGHSQETELIGLTCAYGNSDMDTVYANTSRLATELSLGVPVMRGGATPKEPVSDAAKFLAEQAAAAPGEISVLATGSLTNLKGAAMVDPRFFDNVKEIVLMGGIQESLVLNGRIMNELNFSCDPEAIFAVLKATCPVAIATSQACLPATFTKREFADELGRDSWLMRECGYWFDWMSNGYDMTAFICWDVVAAAALTQPELFEATTLPVTLNERLMRVGYLESAAPGAPQREILVPHIKDAEAFKNACFDAWKKASMTLGLDVE